MGSHLSISEVAFEIENQKNVILRLFEKKLKSQIGLPLEIMLESIEELIPKQIDFLIQALIKKSKFEMNHDLSSTKSLPLELLVSQFIILRDVIIEVLERKGIIDIEASNIIWKNIVNSIRTVVINFEIQKEAESAEMKLRLKESDFANESIRAQIITSRQNEERYKTLVQGVEDYAVFTTDVNGIINFWNPGAERIGKYPSGEVIGSPIDILYPASGILKDEPKHHLHVALIEGRYRGEGMRRRKNDEVFLADVYIRPIFQNGKHLGFANVISDLSERKKLLQASNISKAEIVDLKSEREVREQFVRNLSHDLKNPLMIARAATELLTRGLKGDDKNFRYIDKILLSLDRSNKMINDLLDANRLKAGNGIPLNILNWDLLRIVRNVCEDYALAGSKIHLEIPNHEIKGSWDGEGVRRILENLIGNAVKYGDSQTVIDVTVIEMENEISLKVHNMGDTILPDEKATLFELFKRSDNVSKTQSGWGIGLSLVKAITEAHGGTIEVESLLIEGTTFTVNLPRYCT